MTRNHKPDEEINLQDAYNQLFKECAKMKKLNNLTLKKLNEVEFEKESLNAKLFDLNALIDFLRSQNCMLIDKVWLLRMSL